MNQTRYGIYEEKSDLRAHVSVVVKRLYVFPTKNAVDTIGKKEYPEVPVYTGSILTAIGKLVPPKDIDEIQVIDIPDEAFQLAKFRDSDSTSKKGQKAVQVVKFCIQQNYFPLFLSTSEVNDLDLQISGTDLIITANYKIQVKCDWRAGSKRRGGTGNLFIQLDERNPYSQH